MKGFSKRYTGKGPRYGPLFKAVRDLPCHFCVEGYVGPGHEDGGRTLGQQGGPTAHHIGRLDAQGMIPVDGGAHDLCAGRGGDTSIAHFRAWLEEKEGLPWREALEAIGLRYIERVRHHE